VSLLAAKSDSAECPASAANDGADHLAMTDGDRFAKLPKVCRCSELCPICFGMTIKLAPASGNWVV
jgi:hypothetical protein